MRLAVLIIGLLAGLLFILFGFTELIFSTGGAEHAGFDQGATAFWVGLFTWLIAVAFVLPWPLVSVVAFAIAAAVLLPSGSNYGFLGLWGAASVVLAALSFLGWVGKRRAGRAEKADKVAQAERDARYEALLTAPRQTPEQQQRAAGVPCHACGALNPIGTRFCGNCGANLAGNQPGTA